MLQLITSPTVAPAPSYGRHHRWPPVAAAEGPGTEDLLRVVHHLLRNGFAVRAADLGDCDGDVTIDLGVGGEPVGEVVDTLAAHAAWHEDYVRFTTPAGIGVRLTWQSECPDCHKAAEPGCCEPGDTARSLARWDAS